MCLFKIVDNKIVKADEAEVIVCVKYHTLIIIQYRSEIIMIYIL